jgi:hypothetical protein
VSDSTVAPPFDVGDRVVARHNLGGFFRATVRRGVFGVVTERRPDGAVRVAFSNDQHLTLDPADVERDYLDD